jgi:CubicO group peptidase (beta-lactamase class C family)
MAERRSSGTTTEAFAPVREAFEGVLDARAGSGSALAVWCDGEWVVDLWGGASDAAGTRPWRADTLVMPYSVAKPFTAVCALVLVERGLLDLDRPLQTWWPELRTRATLRQVLSHRAGLVVLDEPAPTDVFFDWDRLCGLLAQQEPSWEPGTASGESALFFGHLVGEVVRRVDGRSLGRFLAEEICEPAELDFHVGLGPAELARTAELSGFGPELNPGPDPGPLYERALANPPGVRDPHVVNSEAWRRAEIPAVNGHGTARAVAGLYVALQQGRILGPNLLSELVTGPLDFDLVIGEERTWGLGVVVEQDGWGHGGLGGSVGWWSQEGGYAFGFVTGHVGDYERSARLENAVRDVVGLPPV